MGMKKIILIFFISSVFISITGGAESRYRQMELNVSGGYGLGTGGYETLENLSSLSLRYSYWLNDTSTLDLSFAHLSGDYELTIIREFIGEDKERVDWSANLWTIGFRYQPEWDFFMDVGLGAGLGYHTWETDSDFVKGQKGESLIYYLLLDLKYPIRPWLGLGFYLQPYYFPISGRMEKTLFIDFTGEPTIQYNKLENEIMWNIGAWVAIRVY